MARILCVTGDVPAVLYAGVELARRLARAGHQVTYASPADVRELVAANGLDFEPLEPSRYDEFLAADRRAGPPERLRRLGRRREQALDSLAVEDFVRCVRGLRPDLVLIEAEMHEQIIAATALGVPIALLNSFVSIWRCPGLPPPHHLARPGVGWRGTRAGSWLLWRLLRWGKRRRAWTQKLRRIGCDRLSLLRLLARRSGFDFRDETDFSQWLMPFTYRRLPVLSLHAKEFEFPHAPPEVARYVGPMVLERRGDRDMADDVRPELARIFESRRRGDRALIYAGFGSFFSTDLGLLRRLVEAVAERPEWELLISLGGRIAPAELGPLPGNVHPFAWVPQLEVLEHADAAVTHGGINTVDECVLAGVPMLIYCGFETDMGGTTSRAVHHGIGIAGDRRRDGARRIGSRIERLLREPQFRSRVSELRAAYAAYAENRVAERAVESLLARQGRAHEP